jgi:hypothetical protein
MVVEFFQPRGLIFRLGVPWLAAAPAFFAASSDRTATRTSPPRSITRTSRAELLSPAIRNDMLRAGSAMLARADEVSPPLKICAAVAALSIGFPGSGRAISGARASDGARIASIPAPECPLAASAGRGDRG